MNAPQARLYLPLSRTSLNRVIEHGPDAGAQRMGPYEMLTLALLCQAHAQHQRNAQTGAATLLTPALEKGFKLLSESTDPGDRARVFYTQAVTRESAAAVSRWMDQNDVALLSSEAVERGHYLTLKGLWRTSFQSECHDSANRVERPYALTAGAAYLPEDPITTDPAKAAIEYEQQDAQASRWTRESREVAFTREQTRLASRFYAERGEPHAVSAVAGSGKTHQLPLLLEMIPRHQRGLIVWGEQQRQSLKARLPNAVQHDTPIWSISELANHQLEAMGYPLGLSRKRQRVNHQLTDAQYATLLSVKDSHYGKPPAHWGRLARQTLARFCASADTDIGHTHVPRESRMSPPDQMLWIIALAQRLWGLTQHPEQGASLMPPLRLYHKLKIIDQAGRGLINSRRILLVDESHDMQPVQNRLIESSESVIWSFGDPLQRLNGLAPQRHHAQRFENTQSVRSPSPMSSAINQLIAHHPHRYDLPYEAVGDDTGNVYYYQAHTPVPDHGVMITRTVLDALGHFAAQVERGRNPVFEPATATAVPDLVRALGRAWHSAPAYHYELGHLRHWADFTRTHGKRLTGQHVVRLFQRHSLERIQSMLERAGNSHRSADLRIGHIEAVKNRDYARVWITGQLLGKLDDGNPKRVGEALSRVYLAMTRANHSLWLPEYFTDWLARHTQGEDVSY